MEEAAGTALLALGAKDMAVPNEVAAEEKPNLYTIMLAPLKLVSPLLKDPFLAPPSS